MTTPDQPTTIACNLGAFSTDERVRHRALIEQLRASVEQIEELPNGCLFHYPEESKLLMTAAEFIAMESRCCSFFDFSIEKAAGSSPIRLRVTGPDGAKQIIMAALSPVGGEPLYGASI